MGLGLALCTIEGLLEIVHQVLDIFKPELTDTASEHRSQVLQSFAESSDAIGKIRQAMRHL